MRLAIFGGTFDPIHEAHLRVAREAADRFSLDKVLFVAAAHPPHKPGCAAASFEHRLRMVELACASDPRFEASRLEDRPGKSYSFDTITRVRALQPSDQLFFVIGADAFAEIGLWYRSAEVVAAVDFIVVSRPGYQYPVPDGARVHRLETLALPVSSSEIRRRVALGESPPELPPNVLQYLQEQRLYLR